jgi:hypothetical protein
LARAVALAALAVLLLARPASAAEIGVAPTPTPSPAGTAQPAKAAMPKFDPCAGPLELMNKVGITPCVLTKDQFVASGGYINGTINGNGVINGVANTPFHGDLQLYQGSIAAGLTNDSQISIGIPAYTSLKFRGAGPSEAGSSGWTLNYQQRFFVDLHSGTQATLTLTDSTPGTLSFTSTGGPTYQLGIIAGRPLTKTLAVTLQALGIYAKANSSSPYGAAFQPSLVLSNKSPGGTLLGVVVIHTFNPNVWPVAGIVEQQIGRRFMMQAVYGSLGYQNTFFPSSPYVSSVVVGSNPKVIGATMFYLLGKAKDLPKLPPAQVPAAVPGQ